MNHHEPRLTAAAIDGLLLDTSPYLSCDDCFDQIDTYVERLLADPEHRDLPMQVHLRACGACAEEAEALLELLTSGE
ncbi:hypothetical protein [Nocardioides sp. AE5]|uniref:hypothetical protein n=1 Tax=Nocardioides sp. AE5 TaxID=2962573 RepID=UPI002880D838|nr:hypothetical protein [Nocardioides sp. AE5]MDT0203098.1 hypothetical protein [Nocardioides sp. AE5]